MITYTAGTYEYCPRGAGDEAAHRRKFLIHLEVDGRLHCVMSEMYEHLELQKRVELHAMDERCKGA